MTRDELLEIAQKMAQPIDFDGLQREGVVLKDGAWYKVPDIMRLPDHATIQIRALESNSQGVKVQFASDKERQRATKLVKKIETSLQP